MIPSRDLPTAALFLALALLFGCSPAAVHVALDPVDLSLLTETDCKSVVIEDDISVTVVRSTGGRGWGLIGALVDKSNTKKRSRRAEELIPPLHEQTPDVDFRKQFADALTFTMRDIPWLNIQDVESSAAIPTKDDLQAITRPMLHMNTHYNLTPDCRHFTVSTLARIWLPKEKNAMYMGSFFYVSDPVGQAEFHDAVAMWANNGATAYRAAISDGIAEIMKMIRQDLPPDRDLPVISTGDWVRLRWTDPQTNKVLNWTCTILDETSDRVIFREKGGNIWSLPASLVSESQEPEEDLYEL